MLFNKEADRTLSHTCLQLLF